MDASLSRFPCGAAEVHALVQIEVLVALSVIKYSKLAVAQ